MMNTRQIESGINYLARQTGIIFRVPRPRIWATVFVSVVAIAPWGEGIVTTTVVGQDHPSVARIEAQWDDVFTKKSGWTGGDGAGTVDLGDGRVLWMFGDSFIGGIAKGKHAPGSHMINNVYAVQTLKDRLNPSRDNFEFAWGPLSEGKDKKPTAWIIPDRENVDSNQTATSDSKRKPWYWPAGGGCLIENNGNKKLVLFLFHVGSNGKEGIWGFENIGGAMAVVENPSQPIAEWAIRQHDLNFATVSRDDANHPSDIPSPHETNWGQACVADRIQSGNTEAEYIYVYGDQNRKGRNRKLVVARVHADEIEDFSKWKFFSGQAGWVSDVNAVVPIAEQGAPEFSVEKIEYQGAIKYVMVQSHWMLGPEIYIRTADAPEGPWSNPFSVYHVPDVQKSKNYFTYAAKGHASVSPPNRLLISYVVNSNDFWEMAGDATIYRPRFISIPLSTIFRAR